MHKSYDSFWKWGNAQKKMAFVQISSPIEASLIPEAQPMQLVNVGTGSNENHNESFAALNILAAVAAGVVEMEDKEGKGGCGQWEMVKPTRFRAPSSHKLVIRRACNGALQCVSSERQPLPRFKRAHDDKDQVAVPHNHVPRFKRPRNISSKYSDFVLH
ncbi:hypothetical protein SUGI_0632460 [Cryptomeria japonica]|uniref:uncharacterized protein LOC131037468 n=1 Tax=Cryptomeria japonica TaxID=3369 RepID=UPI0024148498|nr:uncharacterized protein LOC131037468 [Cryptomeria japonica]GLJ31515.1 hypothetical protein SUGI_0632460 [Cryptomeria japonica]